MKKLLILCLLGLGCRDISKNVLCPCVVTKVEKTTQSGKAVYELKVTGQSVHENAPRDKSFTFYTQIYHALGDTIK